MKNSETYNATIESFRDFGARVTLEYSEEHGVPTGEMLDKFTYKLGPTVQEIYGY